MYYLYSNAIGSKWSDWKDMIDGGNADTLDGKHASDFAPSGFGLGGACTIITDWNNAINSGFYMGSGVTNAPDVGWWMGYVICHNVNWVVQVINRFDGNREWRQRFKVNGVWTEWTRPNDNGNADTVDGSHAWQMQTLTSAGGTHGSEAWLAQIQFNRDGDGRFKLFVGDGITHQSKVDFATIGYLGVNDADYGNAKSRNVFEMPSNPTGGNNGDIWIKYS